jgi:hypothetical protein
MTQRNFSPKVPNHIKLSVEVRNDVYNGIRVFLEKKLFYFFGNLNDHFRACFGPSVKNLICTIRSVNPIGHFSCGTLFPTIFTNFLRISKTVIFTILGENSPFPFRSSQNLHARISFKIAFFTGLLQNKILTLSKSLF